MFRIGVVGFGYWGPNIVRNFIGGDGFRVEKICDANPEALKRAQKMYPTIKKTSDWEAMVTGTSVDAVAVITPVSTHFDIAKKALENGKHVFVEKPFTASVAQAKELIELAERKNLTIMVDHTFLFTGAVKKIKELVDGGALGNIFYYDSTRVNLGLFQHDVNVLWDLAAHDLAIMDYILKGKPKSIVATGVNHVTDREYVAYVTIFFENDMIAHCNVNWLSPVKVRTTLLGGEKKMLVWNDLDADEKIRVYDKGINVETSENIYDMLVSYRSGDMWSPKVEQTEALRLETQYFVDCIRNGQRPINDGPAGLRVVEILEAADKSMKERGKSVCM